MDRAQWKRCAQGCKDDFSCLDIAKKAINMLPAVLDTSPILNVTLNGEDHNLHLCIKQCLFCGTSGMCYVALLNIPVIHIITILDAYNIYFVYISLHGHSRSMFHERPVMFTA